MDLLVRENSEANHICGCVCVGGEGVTQTMPKLTHLSCRGSATLLPQAHSRPSLVGILQRRGSCWHRCVFHLESSPPRRRAAEKKEAKHSSLLIHDDNEKKGEAGHVLSVISYQKTQFFFILFFLEGGGRNWNWRKTSIVRPFAFSTGASLLVDGWKSPVDLLLWIILFFEHHIRGKRLSFSTCLLFLLLCQSAAPVTTRRYILFAPMFRCRCFFQFFTPKALIMTVREPQVLRPLFMMHA